MRRNPLSRTNTSYLQSLFALVLVVGILLTAKHVFVPLALAVLFTFVMTPLVIQAQRLGLPRVPAVLGVVCLSLIVLSVVAWGVESQLARLAEDLPAHRHDIQKKLSRLSMSGGSFGRVIDTFKSNTEIVSDANAKTRPEQPVIAEKPAESPLQQLTATASTLLEPVASAALVMILVVFMLIRREDLRNRVIGLLGHGRLTGTTRVLVEAAERVSRFLLMQLVINVTFGLLFGVTLLLIKVPYAFLWGFLAVLLRFVPYIGSWIAAAMPLLFSLAESPGWTQPIIILAAFVALEMVTANVAEPLLFGHSTGVSAVALLVAAVFWSWVWGPIGLVLSTPLTVCMVVLGQHVPRLHFLSLLLSDQPPLPPHASFYQRLLAGDLKEALAIAQAEAAAEGIDQLPDRVFLPAMLLARRDRENDGLSADDEAFIFDSTEQILKDVQATQPTPARVLPELSGGPPQALVLGLPAHHRSEELTLQMLDLVMRTCPCRVQAVTTKTLPVEVEATIEREKPAVVFVAVLPPGGTVQARYLCRRLRRASRSR